MARRIHFVGLFTLTILMAGLMLTGASPVLALANTPDDFFLTFNHTEYVNTATRRHGALTVLVTFRHIGIPNQRLTRIADKTDRVGHCRARMEAFQKVVPNGSANDFVRGVQDYDGGHGLFVLPTVLVARSLPDLDTNAGPGGTWAVNRIVNAVGWTLPRAGAASIYADNPADRPTIGPWEDRMSYGAERIFQYVEAAEAGYAAVSEDSPSQGDIDLHSILGREPGPPARPVSPGADETVTWTAHLRTFFWLDCDNDGVPELLFFRVDWGFDLALRGFADDAKDTLGKLTSTGAMIVTHPPDGYPDAAIVNGPISVPLQRDRWTLTHQQAEPR